MSLKPHHYRLVDLADSADSLWKYCLDDKSHSPDCSGNPTASDGKS